MDENHTENDIENDAENRAPAEQAPAEPQPAPLDDTAIVHAALAQNVPVSAPAGAPDVEADATVDTDAHEKRRRRHRRRVVGIAAGASAFVLATTGIGVATAVQLTASRTTDATQSQTTDGTTTTPGDGTGFGGTANGYGPGSGSFGGTFPGGSSGSSSGTGSGTSTSTTATDAESAGVVLIDTVLGYENGAAAGTGIVLSSDGEILTNNHVVEGATKITVTIASTGKTYTATVVGTDSVDDIAVLQLEGASGLTVADLDTSGTVAVGDAITGVGNAEGQGYLSAAAGSVTALEQQITVADELTGASKTLDGLIQVDAGIVSGDSGGPLLDSDGEVVGIDTAASSNTNDPEGYAIPIEDALKIVDQIEAGTETSSIQIGLPAFLGISYSSQESSSAAGTSTGVTVAGVLDGTPAASAGLVEGDIITAIDGTSVTTTTKLAEIIASHDPGDSVKVSYTTASGAKHTVTVTLSEGPAA